MYNTWFAKKLCRLDKILKDSKRTRDNDYISFSELLYDAIYNHKPNTKLCVRLHYCYTTSILFMLKILTPMLFKTTIPFFWYVSRKRLFCFWFLRPMTTFITHLFLLANLLKSNQINIHNHIFKHMFLFLLFSFDLTIS